MTNKDPQKKKAYSEAQREKTNARRKAYRKRNKEKIKIQSKMYRERNREKILLKKREWYLKNIEVRRMKNKEWKKNNRHLRREQHKRYRLRYSDKISKNKTAYRKENPDRIREWKRSRRAAKKKGTVPLTEREKQSILILERTRQILSKETGTVYHIDHILPLSHGGVHHPINLRILEGENNLSKHDKLLPEGIALAYEHYRLYHDRISPERAQEFIQQLAKGLGLSDEDLNDLIEGKPLKRKPTLEDFLS